MILNAQRAHSMETLELTIDNPLLILLNPYAKQNKWWRDRKGILYLRRDGLIDYASDHSTKVTKVMSQEFVKQSIRDGWDVYLSYPNHPWYTAEFIGWKHELDRVTIPVQSCNFALSA
jgi:hypothetical protein